LLAYNGGTSAQSLKVNWGNQSFTYSIPARTSATFTWSGTQGNGGTGGAVTGYGGKCVDVAGANSANGTAVQLYTCNGSAAQQWTFTNGTMQALGKCLDAVGNGTANGTRVQLWDCTGGGNQQWARNAANDIVNAQSGRCLDVTGPSSADGTPLQLWDCTGASNQKWT
jgi:glucosylceramidase